jgi:hypothetical protein
MPKGVHFMGDGSPPVVSAALSMALAANRCCLGQVRWLCKLRSAL